MTLADQSGNPQDMPNPTGNAGRRIGLNQATTESLGDHAMNQRAGCARCGGVSSLRGGDAGGTNSPCHGFTGGVQVGGTPVLIPHVQIVLVLWDHYYITNPLAVGFAKQLITDLVTGPFMNGLAQYGIHRGSLVNTIVVDTASSNPASNFPAPSTWDIGDGNDATQILTWINNGNVTPKPQRPSKGAPPNILYLLFMPRSTQLTNGTNTDGSPNTNVCGWHHNAKLGDSDNTPVYWGLVRTDTAAANTTSEQAFVDSVAFCVSHELSEAVTNPDGNGFFAPNVQGQSCEIGDLCEADSAGNLKLVSYTVSGRTYQVEQYWSNWDNACINGDQPVSLRKFAKAINFDPANGLRSLPLLGQNANTISIDYIADRSFPP